MNRAITVHFELPPDQDATLTQVCQTFRISETEFFRQAATFVFLRVQSGAGLEGNLLQSLEADQLGLQGLRVRTAQLLLLAEKSLADSAALQAAVRAKHAQSLGE